VGIGLESVLFWISLKGCMVEIGIFSVNILLLFGLVEQLFPFVA